MVKFQKNSIILLSVLFVLAISAITFFLSACLVATERGPHYAHDPAARRGDLVSIQGLWVITASNYSGKLEFHWEGRIWTGRVWFDALRRWEPLTDIFFDPRTGELQFTRADYNQRYTDNQRYTGTLSGNQILGTFTTPAGGSGPWEARRH
jgi:hypothetical protein